MSSVTVPVENSSAAHASKQLVDKWLAKNEEYTLTSNNATSEVLNFRSAETVAGAECASRNFATHRNHPAFADSSNKTASKTAAFEPFYFLHVADPQYGMNASYTERASKANWSYERNLVQTAAKQINLMIPAPAFVAVTGDLVHAMPGLPEKAAQEVDLLEDFSNISQQIPIVYMPGNHDVGDIVTAEAVKSYTRRFGDDYYAFTYKQVRFIVLNSQFFKPLCGEKIEPDGTTTVVPKPAAETEELQKFFFTWLDDQLEISHRGCASGSFAYTVIFQHIPWFLTDADEENQYFNIEKPLRSTYMKKFELAGVKAVLCGHLHQNAEGIYNDKVAVVTRTALCVNLDEDPPGLGTVICYSDRIACQYYATANVPTAVKL